MTCDMATEVAAHITGTVWEIRVNVGDRVEAEQVVVVLESMKMEMPVEAPEARSRHTEIQYRLLELGIALGLALGDPLRQGAPDDELTRGRRRAALTTLGAPP